MKQSTMCANVMEAIDMEEPIDIPETVNELVGICSDMFDIVLRISNIGMLSNHIYEAAMDRHAECIMDTIVEITIAINELEEIECQ